MRSIFNAILFKKAPVVVHNGLLDFMFLYYSFYADLPNELPTFITDLNDLFPSGIYDTKYVADFVTREKSSFLSLLFRK